MMEWINVNDKLPENDVFVLGHWAKFITDKDLDWEWHDSLSRYEVVKCLRNYMGLPIEWVSENHDNELEGINPPTHWMQLPHPPINPPKE